MSAKATKNKAATPSVEAERSEGNEAQDEKQNGEAQASDSSKAVESEIPDIDEGEIDTNVDISKPKARNSGRSASPASSVTSPTSTENREFAEDEAAATEATRPANPPLPSEPIPSAQTSAGPPLPAEPVPGAQTSSAPPLPSEPLPSASQSTAATAPLPTASAPAAQPEDDGWEYHWNASTDSYWFYNRYTQVWQADNPRLQPQAAYPPAPGVPQQPPAPIIVAGQPISDPASLSGGYNPAIHGDYDPNAWYAQAARAAEKPSTTAVYDPATGEYGSAGFFNRQTGQWQHPDQGPERHSDEAKSKRQMNNFFDVDAAANEFEGRSLKAERSGKKPTKEELKAYKEKRRARKEEKRRAWLRD